MFESFEELKKFEAEKWEDGFLAALKHFGYVRPVDVIDKLNPYKDTGDRDD